METNNYHTSIIVNASAGEAMKNISQINRWWKNDFKGCAEKLNDSFTVPFGDSSFVDFAVSEFVPEKKVVWKVTDCFLPWFQNKKEWIGTEVVFEILPSKDYIKIEFTHVGLVPTLECYGVCQKGWEGHIHTLSNFINDRIGLPA